MLGIINRFLSFAAVIIIPKFAAKFNSKFYSKNYSGIMRFVTNISCYSNFVICQQDRFCLRLPYNMSNGTALLLFDEGGCIAATIGI
jgi:hypothetical protein